MCGDRVVRQLGTLCLHSGGRQRGTEAGAQAACLYSLSIHSRTQENSFRVGLSTSTNVR